MHFHEGLIWYVLEIGSLVNLPTLLKLNFILVAFLDTSSFLAHRNIVVKIFQTWFMGRKGKMHRIGSCDFINNYRWIKTAFDLFLWSHACLVILFFIFAIQDRVMLFLPIDNPWLKRRNYATRKQTDWSLLSLWFAPEPWRNVPLKEVQVNLCQKHLFLDQLTHNMTNDCSLIYQLSTWKLQAQNMGRTCVQKLFWISKQ